MRRVQRICNLNTQIEQFIQSSGPRHRRSRSVSPFQILHHQIRLAFAFADVIHGADIGLIQCRGGASFTAESGHDSSHQGIPRPEAALWQPYGQDGCR